MPLLCGWRTPVMMSQEAKQRIEGEVESIRSAVEKENTASGKHSALRAAYAKSESPYVKEGVLSMAIDLAGPELEPLLINVVQSEPDVRLRIMAVDALAEHGSPTAEQPLLDCAENDPEGLAGWDCIRRRMTARRNAYLALSEIGLRHPAARESIAQSVAALPVTGEGLKDAKIQALYVLTQDTSLLEPFFERLQSDDPDIRQRGVVAFRFLKLTEAPAELAELLDDPNRKVRSWVALVLGEIGDPATVPVLIDRAKDKSEDRSVRCNAIFSLGRMRAEPALTALETLLNEESVEVNAAIAWSKITGERHPLVPEGYGLD